MALLAQLRPAIAQWKSAELIAVMEAAGLPGGKVNEIPEVLDHPQIEARGLVHKMARSDGTPVKVLGFPARLSASPATYRHAPPRSGEDTVAVLSERLGLGKHEIERLLAAGVIAEAL